MQVRSRIIRHAAFVAARRDVVQAIDRALPGTIVFVIGMPGSGKTELRLDVMPELAGDLTRWGPGRMPLMGVRAAPTDRSFFSPKDFQARLRAELRTPLMDWYVPRDAVDAAAFETLKREIAQCEAMWHDVRHSESENAMRRQFEIGSRMRCLEYLFIDQAGSIARTQRKHDPSDHMYSLMCMAEEIPIVLVMMGTPRMAALWEGDSEIRRRCQKVFLARYKNTETDLVNLLRLCINLTHDLRFAENAHPTKTIKLVYHATCGVFDEIKSFYQRAESRRQAEGAPVITLKHLENAVLTPKELEGLYSTCQRFDDICSAADLSKMPELLVPKSGDAK